jgi:hypothetical protein
MLYQMIQQLCDDFQQSWCPYEPWLLDERRNILVIAGVNPKECQIIPQTFAEVEPF